MSVRDSLARDLTALLGASCVSTDGEDILAHSGDALGAWRAFHAAPLLERRPQVVVRPTTVEQVRILLAWASQRDVPVVPFGGGTGVMGGVVPVQGGIALDMKGMARILEVDKESHLVRAEAGILLGDLDTALTPYGLFLGHDPWSQPIATLGGAIATNGVGYLAGRYGPMGAQVRALQVVLATGEVLETRPIPKHLALDFNALFIGTEGTLGVITQATIEVFPTPEKRILMAWGFPSFEAGYSAVMEMFHLGLRPSVLDFSQECWNEGHSEVLLYLGFEGCLEEARGASQRARRICTAAGGQDLGRARAQTFWAQRHRSAERYRQEVLARPPSQRRPRPWRMDYLHTAIPAGRVPEYRRQAQAILQRYPVVVREWSLWGRPEFFSVLFSADAHPQAEPTTIASLVDTLLALAQDLGGTMEYCHGVGIKLAHLLPREWGQGQQVFRHIKKALDPQGILNPGKLEGTG
ncbi:MAG: FAD-binding oxidoreductase [Dehalococcoidia bacterium]|nr:FAD-binding oxidoreductase [Dehalococcoidia bacterium]MDW8119459.1 FAD-binding oxidoreductase [Chloroflexota bacterium]